MAKTQISKCAVKLGRRGGKATAAKKKSASRKKR
jgi:hypothetical protein